MKRFILFLLYVAFPVSALAAVADDPETIDGYLSEGEHSSHIVLENFEELIVNGGGAERITAKNYSYIEVQYTSTPLTNSSGIYDIFLGDYSELLYLGEMPAITNSISVGGDASAILKGGTINYLTIGHTSSDTCEVTIYCLEGYQKSQSGISGVWGDGITTFNIQFLNVGGPYPPTADYVNVIIIPEPATLTLFGLGGLLLRYRHKR